MIRFNCPTCGAALSAPDQAAGKSAPCKKCGETLRVLGEPPGLPRKPASPVATAPRPASQLPRAAEWEDSEGRGDDAPARPRRKAEASGGASAHSLGIGAMVLGIVGLLLSLIPCVGWIGLPLSGLGLLLGLVGGVVALARGGRGIGFPIAGSAICGLALLIGGFWASLVFGTAKAVDDAGKRTTADAPTTGAPAASYNPARPAPAQPSRPMFVGVWRSQNGIEMVFKVDGAYELVADGELKKGYWKVRDSSHIEIREHKNESENEEALVLEYWMSDSDTMSARLAGRTEFGVMQRVRQP